MGEQIFIDWAIHFNLRHPKSRKPTLIYVVVTLNGRQLKINAGIKVYACQWDKTRQIARMSGGLNSLDCKNNAIANKKIVEIVMQVESLKQYLCEHTELLADEAKIRALLVEYINPNIKIKMSANKNIEPQRASLVFLNVISKCYDIEKQGVKQKISIVRDFCKWMESNGGDTLDNVSKQTLVAYEMFLNTTPTNRSKKGAEFKTVKTKMGHIMSVIRKAKNLDYFPYQLNMGVENNKLQTKKKKDDGYSRSFALSDDEVKQLYSYQGLSDSEAEIRDLFVLQCEMGQRISGMLVWLRGDYREDNGFFDMMSTKTKKEVSIPITKRIREIQERYKGGMKLMEGKKESTIINKIDRTIKKIAKDVGLNRNHTYQTQIGVEVFEKTSPICELMRSHIARHTFITLRLRDGWDKDEIKVVSGHDNDDMIDYVYAHLTQEDRKEKISRRINKVNDAKVPSCTKETDGVVLLNEIERLAIVNNEQKQINKKQEQIIVERNQSVKRLSDINAIVRQHDEYSGRRLTELMEFGNLTGSDVDISEYSKDDLK